jgi:hypothetical protein
VAARLLHYAALDFKGARRVFACDTEVGPRLRRLDTSCNSAPWPR